MSPAKTLRSTEAKVEEKPVPRVESNQPMPSLDAPEEIDATAEPKNEESFFYLLVDKSVNGYNVRGNVERDKATLLNRWHNRTTGKRWILKFKLPD